MTRDSVGELRVSVDDGVPISMMNTSLYIIHYLVDGG